MIVYLIRSCPILFGKIIDKCFKALGKIVAAPIDPRKKSSLYFLTVKIPVVSGNLPFPGRLVHRVGTVLNSTNPRRRGAISLFGGALRSISMSRLDADLYSRVAQLRALMSQLHVGKRKGNEHVTLLYILSISHLVPSCMSPTRLPGLVLLLTTINDLSNV